MCCNNIQYDVKCKYSAEKGDIVIKNAGILGLGALGGMYGEFLSRAIGRDNVYIIGDNERLERYRDKGVYINGKKADFNYAFDKKELDLLIVATKFHQLENALEAAKDFVGEKTIIISLLNGITSENVIADVIGKGAILYCVAYGMDAQKYGNHIEFKNYGTLAIGDADNKELSHKVKELKEFFDSINFSYEIPKSMLNKLWSKFMFNVGINQVCAAYNLHYGDVQKEGRYRDIMIGAMKEVIETAVKMDIPLSKDDIEYWLKVTDKLDPESMPSMAQDILNKSKTEVEIFADTVISLSGKYNISVPINEELGRIIHKKENNYEL